MERTTEHVTSFFSFGVLASIILIGSICYFIFWEIKTKKTGHALFGFLLCLTTLAPVSGIIPINGLLYEHWLYVPLAGFFIILFRAFTLLFSSFLKQEWAKQLLFTIGGVIVFLFVILTTRQNNIWSDPITFYTYTLQFTKSARLENNLGMSYADIGDINNTIAHYKKSIILSPNYPQTHNNLGLAYLQSGQYDLAEKELKEALHLAPELTVAKINLLKLYLATKQFQKAKDLSNNDPRVLEIIKSLE
jgi:tetratricopeptide (TPR) repeat protein